MSSTQSRMTEEPTDENGEIPRAEETVLGIPTPTVIIIATILAFLALWEVLSQVAFARLTIIFPSLVQIAGGVMDVLSTGSFYYDLAITAQEVVIGFVLATIIGLVFGILVGSSDYLAKAIEPLIYYFSTIPKIALYPLFLVTLGVGYESKVAMGFFSAIFPVMVNTITGARHVQKNLLKVARTYDATLWERVKFVYLPSMVTHIVNGLRLAVGVAIIGSLLGELAASQAGIGNRIQFYFANLQTARMYGVLILVFVVTFALNTALLKLQEYLNEKGYGSEGTSESTGF